jgi:hypothetical protein
LLIHLYRPYHLPQGGDQVSVAPASPLHTNFNPATYNLILINSRPTCNTIPSIPTIDHARYGEGRSLAKSNSGVTTR